MNRDTPPVSRSTVARLAGNFKNLSVESLERAILEKAFWAALISVGIAFLFGFLKSQNQSEILKNIDEVFFDVFAAVGASFLTYKFIERMVETARRWDKESYLSNTFDNIYHRNFSKKMVEGIIRDIDRHTFEIKKVACKIIMEKSGSSYHITFTIQQDISVLESFRDRDMHLAQHAGDKDSWTLDNFRLNYVSSRKESSYYYRDPLRRTEDLEITESHIKCSSLEAARGEKLERIWTIKKWFLNGVMSNHVFLDGANEVVIEIVVPKITDFESCPLQIWYGLDADGKPIPKPKSVI